MEAGTPGVLVTLEAKPGRESALAEFLNAGLELALAETGMRTWYAFRITASRFGIYDTFLDESSRQSHLSGPMAQALNEIADELLAREPEISQLDVLVEKS